METAVRPEYLTYKQVESYCGGMSRTTAWRLIKAGEIEAVKIGRLVKVRRASLDDYMARHEFKQQGS